MSAIEKIRVHYPRDEHHVQFYKDNDFIAEAVTDFFEPGFTAGQPLVLVCTPEHRDQIYNLLINRDCRVHEALQKGQFRWLDARETLAQFMVDGMPDPVLFTKSVGRVLQDIRLGREHLTTRAFGEMVDLLLRDGNPEAAISLEEMWNGLGPEYGFSLLCAYSMGNLYREEQWKYFQMVCDQHTKLPTEKIQAIQQEYGIDFLEESA